MSECFYESKKAFAIRRQRVDDSPALAGFIDQARLRQFFGVFRNGLNVAVDGFAYPVQCDPVIVSDDE